MKKVLLVLFLVLGLSSCDMRISDSEGWLIWNLSSMSNDSVLVQSHEGFMVIEESQIGKFYNEEILTTPNKIYNVLNIPIDVKVTYPLKSSYWVEVLPSDYLEF